MMQVQPFTSNDIPFLVLLQPEGWHDIVPVYTFYNASPFCHPIKITIANEIVGVGTTIMHNDVAWLAHIIVHPDYRNKGIGKLITQTLIDNIDARICKTIYLIATALGEPVYEKIGFITETEYLFYKEILPINNVTLSSNILPYNQTHLSQIQKIDQQVSSEDRLFHFEMHLSNSFVYISNNAVEGYYIPNFDEGLIIANSSKAGIELMTKRLLTKENAAFPINNIEAIAYMRIHGFEPFKTAKRMRLGEIRTINYSYIYNRIAGNIG